MLVKDRDGKMQVRKRHLIQVGTPANTVAHKGEGAVVAIPDDTEVLEPQRAQTKGIEGQMPG